jgi:hypothetical protein
MSAYNAQNKLARATSAGRSIVKDPGDGGTIEAKTIQLAVCVVTGGTTRSIDSATKYGLGHRLIVISQTSSIAVNGVSLADGEAAEFVVTLDSNGAKTWAQVVSVLDGDTFVEAAGTDSGDFAAAGLVLASAGADKTAVDTAIEAADLVTKAAAAAAAGLVQVSGGTDKTVEDATPAALGAANINTGDATTDTALIALADALQTLGLITHTWT